MSDDRRSSRGERRSHGRSPVRDSNRSRRSDSRSGSKDRGRRVHSPDHYRDGPEARDGVERSFRDHERRDYEHGEYEGRSHRDHDKRAREKGDYEGRYSRSHGDRETERGEYERKDRERRDIERVGRIDDSHRSDQRRSSGSTMERHRKRSPLPVDERREVKQRGERHHEDKRRRDSSRGCDANVREADRDNWTDGRGHANSAGEDNVMQSRDEAVEEESTSIVFDEEDGDAAEKLLEESRRRRQAILEKYQGSNALSGAENAGIAAEQDHQPSKLRFEPPNGASSADAHSNSFGLGSATGNVTESPLYAEPTIAAAGTKQLASLPLVVKNGVIADGAMKPFPGAMKPLPATTIESPKSGTSNDMFADDMFAQSPGGGRQMARADGAAKEASGVTDNWDDAEGYYSSRVGEVLDGRYEVVAAHGRGVFSTVVKAADLKASAGGRREVAIKIIRSNETMFKAGQQELVILRKIAGGDPEDKRHCVRLLSSFQFRGHLCLVFESLEMNLREVLKKYGRNIGLRLSAVRAYATQLFMALKHLRNCGILHCDIKPDNMLVNEAKNVLKLADFGSAMFSGDNEITPYLVSRFYRAPEIMLGLTYDHALDMWSTGCCLYELYTGKMLFPGRNNNDMLRLHMELKGPFPKKLLKKAQFVNEHFDSDFNFCALEEDPVTKKTIKRIMTNVKPKDMAALLSSPDSENPRSLAAFRDLLDKIFTLDPDKRITASQALNHPFVLGK